ncbi:MAG: hypothetical protein Q4A34_01505 [Candidatus Saccharibacteria bacterium]|nr:hypothetical protein [Candidatus Saccharibacteria bacterium]
MAFNHYAKIRRILAEHDNWYIVRINQPTTAKNFKGELRQFDHYYRVMTSDGQPIKFCKFQQLDRFAQAMDMPAESLPITDNPSSATSRPHHTAHSY